MSKRCPRTEQEHEDGLCGYDEECPIIFHMFTCHDVVSYKRVACQVRSQICRARRAGVKAPFVNLDTDEVEEVDPDERYVIRRLSRDAFW